MKPPCQSRIPAMETLGSKAATRQVALPEVAFEPPRQNSDVLMANMRTPQNSRDAMCSEIKAPVESAKNFGKRRKQG